MDVSSEGANPDGGAAREGSRSLQHEQTKGVGKAQISCGYAEAFQPREQSNQESAHLAK
jgi:hypothetical protein